MTTKQWSKNIIKRKPRTKTNYRSLCLGWHSLSQCFKPCCIWDIILEFTYLSRHTVLLASPRVGCAPCSHPTLKVTSFFIRADKGRLNRCLLCKGRTALLRLVKSMVNSLLISHKAFSMTSFSFWCKTWLQWSHKFHAIPHNSFFIITLTHHLPDHMTLFYFVDVTSSPCVASPSKIFAKNLSSIIQSLLKCAILQLLRTLVTLLSPTLKVGKDYLLNVKVCIIRC